MYPRVGYTCIIVLLTVILSIPATVVTIDHKFGMTEDIGNSLTTSRAEALSCTADLSNSTLKSGETALLSITITNGSIPVYNMTVELSCEVGTFDEDTGSTNFTGQVSVNYTAPALNITEEITISIVANRTEPDEFRTNITVKVLSHIDFISPQVISISPMENSTDVSIVTNITIEFSESMNRSSVAMAISLTPNFEYELIWQGNNLTIKPDPFLMYNTSYRFELSELSRDLYGNSLREYTASFTTEELFTPLLVFNVSIDYKQELYGEEYQVITICIKNGSIPLSNTSITVAALEGNTNSQGGISDKDGNFSFIYTAPKVSSPKSDRIFINVTKEGFEDFRTEFQVNITPRSYHLIQQELFIKDGTMAHGFGMANGTVELNLEEGSNPTPVSTGFIDIFVNVSSQGQGEFLWLNLSIRYLFIPKDSDKQDIAIYLLHSLSGPWLKCLRTGNVPSKNIVWANISFENVDLPLTVAPRTKNTVTQVKGSITGRVLDPTGKGLPDVQVGFYKTDVNIRSVKTSVNGSFEIEGLETGTYEIRVDELGYEPFSLMDQLVIVGENSITITLENEHVLRNGDLSEDTGGYGLYVVFLIFFLLLILLIIVKMYIIRAGNRDRFKNGEEFKSSSDEKRFPIVNRQISTWRDLPKGDLSNKIKAKTRSFGTKKKLPPDMTNKGEFECPVCGIGVSQNTRVCPLCKAVFVDDEFVCPDCGMPLSSKDRNCSICGTIFGESISKKWKSIDEKARRGSSGAIDNFIVEKEWDQ
jgi:hypothetical protein